MLQHPHQSSSHAPIFTLHLSKKKVRLIHPNLSLQRERSLRKSRTYMLMQKVTLGCSPSYTSLQKAKVDNTVFTNIKNDRETEMIPYQIQTAINIHLEKTFGEIKELCDSGTSSNYFILKI